MKFLEKSTYARPENAAISQVVERERPMTHSGGSYSRRPQSPNTQRRIREKKLAASLSDNSVQFETMKAIDSFTKTLNKNKNNRFKGQNLDELLAYDERARD